jgi:hypothetical protein
MRLTTPGTRRRHCAAFTLAEALAALLFLAIVIPVAVQAMYSASLAGEVAARKSVAARIADRVLNESLVMTNWSNGTQSGTTTRNGLDFKWTLTSQTWPQDTMQIVTVEVSYLAQGKPFSVKLSTLATLPGQAATVNNQMQ